MTMARNAQAQRESGSAGEARQIEKEMVRVQALLEDLQRRRIELSHQVKILLMLEILECLFDFHYI